MNITSVSSPAYSNTAGTAIDCTVTFDDGKTYPYTAAPHDTTDYGVAVWHDLTAGRYGPISPFPGVTTDQLLAALAARRYDVQNGGTTVAGTAYKTDTESRLALLTVWVVATANPAFTVDWKTAGGTFVTLDAAQILAAGNAVLAFVQKCFDAEAAIKADVASYASAAAITAAFDAAMAA